MIERAPLPAVRYCIGIRAHFVGDQAFQMFTLAVDDAHMWAKKLVGGADEKITVQPTDINRAVRCVVNRIDVCHSSSLVREPDHLFDIIDGSYGIRGIADR